MSRSFQLLPVREWLCRIFLAAAHEHEGWVDNRGLHTGMPGPLDDLIRELEAYLAAAREAKTEIETEEVKT